MVYKEYYSRGEGKYALKYDDYVTLTVHFGEGEGLARRVLIACSRKVGGTKLNHVVTIVFSHSTRCVVVQYM